MKYYDRRSPLIVIRETASSDHREIPRGKQCIQEGFPGSLAGRPLDDVLCQLLDAANTSAPRAAFIHYYQVLEYAAYHYIDTSTKQELKKIIRDPAILSCDDRQLARLVDALVGRNQADDKKMQSVVSDCVPVSHIASELSEHAAFFHNDVRFDGGYIADPLHVKGGLIDESTTDVKRVVQGLQGIRNVLVHAREKRENRVILPTDENTWKLRHYIPLIRRIAEDVSFRVG